MLVNKQLANLQSLYNIADQQIQLKRNATAESTSRTADIQVALTELTQLQNILGNQATTCVLQRRLAQTVTDNDANSASISLVSRQKDSKTQTAEHSVTIKKSNVPKLYEREIHLNLTQNMVRIYFRDGTKLTFSNLITGDATKSAIGGPHFVKRKRPGPKGGKRSYGLLNFVPFKGQIGFHSDHYRLKQGKDKTGKQKYSDIIEIPGEKSHGCARIPHAESAKFYEKVENGDPVFVYTAEDFKPPSWEKPNE